MMQASLTFLSSRTGKPRNTGITMVMDKGLSVRQAEDVVNAASDYIDFVKFGFGTGLISNNIAEKVRVYQKAGISTFPGGTLFEAFVIRDEFDEYRKLLKKLKCDTVEVSDGSIKMDHKIKCRYIKELAKDFIVLSEVGSKEASRQIKAEDWVDMMQKELRAGATKVIGEGRESGSAGIFSPSGKAHISLIREILSHIELDQIIWEAPLKSQQAWFIKEFGPNVNLGNIPYQEALALETIRLGLRVDTFFHFLPAKFHKFQPK
ncbi:MAG TPA: phosphosulfolactate synthase [Bacteroidales bacterium]|nr:phosphosulfolactate synthase [Bacteroidales bacterium]HPS73363.1 phosphosulfolactate synthase [Bacteroidales bacterium]